VALVISLAACFSSPGVWAQATGMQAVHGAATVSTQGNLTTITTQNGAGSAHSALNWQSFGVAAGSTTQFLQPSATSTSINRVLGNNPSAIFGNLSSNGRLVLVNPSGIAVGAGAVVDTAGFTASTLGMTQSDAVAGRLRFGSAGAVGAAAGLSVDGRILARSGDIVLIAPHVQAGAAALIESPNGATVLAAGQKLELTGRGLEGIHLELQAPDNQAINLGHLSGDAVGVFAGTLKHSGQISAQAVSVQGGKVVLQAAGDTLVSGSIKASALDAKGGNIDVLGQRVALQAGASLDASGAAGGGNVRVGGDFQGRNPDVVNATQTHFDRDATIRADATESGQGGRVIVWADDQTRGDGTISARGGALGGDGGFVEVSGKHRLAFNATVDTRAPLGKTGTLMLDPDDITITSGPVDSYTAPVMFADAPATLDLDVSTIDSATSNVVLQANNDININASVNIGLAGIGFSAEAGGYVNVNQSITTNGGAVSLTAGAAGAAPAPSEGALYVNGAINTNGGNISLHSNLSDVGGNATYIAAPLNAGTGAVNISGQRVDVVGTAALIEGQTININTTAANGNISIEGVTLNSVNGLWIAATGAESDVTVSDSTLTVSGAGDLQLIAEQGSVDATSVMASASSGDILISGGATSAAQYGSGVYLSGGSFIASGAVTIDGSTIQSYANGVEISDDITLSSSAGTSILGLSLAPSDAGNGVRISIGDGFVGLTGSGALIAIGQTNGNYSGVSVYDTINRTGGDIVLQGSAVGSGGNAVDISYSDIYSNGSDVIIEGTGGNGASVSIGGSFIDSGGGNVDVTGGHAGEANYGVSLIDSSTIHAGAGNLTVSGTSQAKGVFIESFSGGMTYSGANVAITGTTSAGSGYPAVYIDNETLSATNSLNITANNGDLVVYGGTISTSGSGGLTLRATGGSPLPARIDIDSSSFVGNVGGGTSEVKLIADRMELGSAISSGAGARTVIHSNSTNRAVSLGGADEAGTLNLTSAELDQIYASALVIGWNDQAGGISIDGAVAPSQLTTLSLINNQLSGPGISQVAPLTIPNLNVDARTVSLSDNTNQISLVSGRYYAGSLDVRSSTGMSVGTVDGVGGIVGSTTGSLFVQAGGLLVVDRNVSASSGSVTLIGDSIALASGKTIQGSAVTLDALGTGNLSLEQGTVDAPSITVRNAGAVLFGNISASTGLTINNISGTVGQQAGTSVDVGMLSADFVSGALVLDETANQFASLGTLSSLSGGLDLVDNTGGLNIADSVSAGGPIRLRTVGDINQSGFINSSAAGDAIVLAAGGNYHNNAGASALSAGSGRWIVYSTSPADNTFGGLMSGETAVYNATIAGNAPGTIAAGNRYVFSQQPSVTVTADTQSRVYDGTATFSAPTKTAVGLVDAALYGNVFTQDTLSGELEISAPSRHVGTYAINQGTLLGPAGYAFNYVPADVTVTQRPLSTWNGLAGDGLWSSAGNWDALPDASNVQAVSIPVGASVAYDLPGTTNLQTLTSSGDLTMANGNLSIGSALNALSFSQSAGNLNGAGSLNVGGSFSQTGGVINLGGSVAIAQTSGNLVVGTIIASGITLAANAGNIAQGGYLSSTGLVTAQSQSGIALTHAGNQFNSFAGNVTGTGHIDLTNTGALDLVQLTTADGGITVNNTGGVVTQGAVNATGGQVSITANSPLTVGAGGVSATGNINLAATNMTSTGNMVLNGSVNSSGGSVTMNAANDLTQNGAVAGATGISATAGNTISFGGSASSMGTPQSYMAGGSPVSAPGSPAPAPTPPAI